MQQQQAQQQQLQQQQQQQPQQQPQPQMHQPGSDHRALRQPAVEHLRHGPKPAASLGANNRAPATARRRVSKDAAPAQHMAGNLQQAASQQPSACGSQTLLPPTVVEGQQQQGKEEPVPPVAPAAESQPEMSEANVLSMLSALEDLAGVLEEHQADLFVTEDDGPTLTSTPKFAQVGAVSSTASATLPQSRGNPEDRPRPSLSSEEATTAAAAAAAAANLGAKAPKQDLQEDPVEQRAAVEVDSATELQRHAEPGAPQPTRPKSVPQSSPDVASTLQALEALAGLLEGPGMADGPREGKAAQPKALAGKVDAAKDDTSTADAAHSSDEDPLSKLEWLLCREEEAKVERNRDIKAWNPLGADGLTDYSSSPGMESDKLEQGMEGPAFEEDHSKWESLWRSCELRWSPKPLPVIHLR
mmetsp:Transcript_869/g.1597  ORF Transcript_869/g.1597 Transcript_869/m.1597 type:complete len:415 (+) Transcript_869:29-1273(+)